MALLEISELAERLTLVDNTWLHVKDGATDYKVRPQVLFDLYNTRTGDAANLTLTKADVGLGNVTDDAQLTIASNLGDLANAATARTNLSVDSSGEVDAKITVFTSRTDNPNSVTKAQVALGNVPNYTITSSITDVSTSKFSSANAVSVLNDKIIALEQNVIPVGGVLMWPTTDAIPAGWVAMDGTNGTIDTRGMFPRGGSLAPGAGQVGVTGGSNTNTHTHNVTITGTALSDQQVPAHVHHNGTAYERADNGGREVVVLKPSLAYPDDGYITSIAGGPPGAAIGVASPHTHAATANDNAGVADNNLPPYYTMIFIQKV